MNKFKTLSEVYDTGIPYDNNDIPEVHQYSDLHEAYDSVYLEESEMKIPNYGSGSVNWSKYRKRLIEIITSDDFDIAIHTKHQKKYGIETFNSSLILNKPEISDFIKQMSPGVAPPARQWPDINVSDGDDILKVKIGHLQKTGQFREEKEGQSSTEVKEGLVSLFFLLKNTDPVTKENYEQKRSSLREAAEEQPEGETPKVLDEIMRFLAGMEGKGDTAHFRHEFNQPLSQAVTLIGSPYKNWSPDRGKIFHDIREAGRIITKYPADKWCPGDIYFINPELESKIYDALATIKSKPGDVENLSLLNSLFVTDWGNTDRPIVAVSLKFKNAQGGKAKDFLKKFIDVGTKDKPYNVSDKDLALNDGQIASEVMRLRGNITDQINKKSTDVGIIYDSRNDTTELEQDPDKLRKKFASLKLIDFLFSTAEAGELDDTIIGAIGFGLSLAGVNPTFYKVIGNTKGTGMDSPEKFTEKGVVALYPLEGDDDPKIIIRDNNTSNKVEINCSIEMGEDIKQVMLSARSNGYTQATLEIERVH
tara:strand:- start:76 stop:1677 length:1602 start_codon:yes stop_codon:yes gene_type:complete